MNPMEKFHTLLEELFQFDAADLDFGIYRILNVKREQIRKFIHEDLGRIADEAFAKYRDERLANIGQLFEEAKQKVMLSLGPDAFIPSGDLKEENKKFPVGKEYLEIRSRQTEAAAIDEIRLQVFNDLYNFFSRYYDEGDFAPQYRYSIRGHKYAIPYNGEEVKLYWANSDQYYVKAGILFRDYAFFTDPAKSCKIIFRTVTAKEELGSNKATKTRFFVLDDEKPFELANGKTLVIRFQHRELTAEEVRKFEAGGGSNAAKQEKINQYIHATVLTEISDPGLKTFLGREYKNDKPLLLYQLSRFSAKNSRDFFIHKNLKKFLSGQLDYFIKADVISIETLEKERFLDKHITRAKAVREIGERIIAFLAQIEDFQKKLWEKKKFVLRTEYVITTDRVPEEFYQEILKNKTQAEEWNVLGFGTAPSKAELQERKLPLDTKHFACEFKERLLERLTENADLDDLLDGLLIRSENWQGLNTLVLKYLDVVQCVYIDPPFNTAASEILYKNNYKHSSWISMMADRIQNAAYLMKSDSVICAAIDDFEISSLTECLSRTFGEDRRLATIAIRSNPHGRAMAAGFSPNHEYALFFGKTDSSVVGRLPRNKKKQERYPESDQQGIFAWINFRKTGAGSMRADRPKLFYPIFVTGKGAIRVPSLTWSVKDQKWESEERPHADEVIVFPLDAEKTERVWNLGWERAQREASLNLLAKLVTGEWQIYRKYRPNQEGALPGTWWEDAKYSATESGTRIIKDLFGERELFAYPKSIYLVEDCLRASNCKPESYVLDFFGGSGTTAHAVMNLNNEDSGKRKFILIEMANYFDTVIIPRIKKVAYSFNWKDGKPQDSGGNGVFFKYQVLEQYEDTLDNLELNENKDALELFGSDYLLKYFLDFETQDNAALVNFEQFKQPFSYKLKVNYEEVGEPQDAVVDLPETFHYLLGLKARKIKVRKDRGRKYLFTLGEKEGRNVAVVWREYDDGWTERDFKRDKEFIIQEIEAWAPQVVYVNGQSVLTPTIGEIRYIEPEIRKLMVG